MKKLLAAMILLAACSGLGRATTYSITSFGGVTVSSAGIHAAGEAILLQANVGESVTYTYSASAATGTLHFQVSDGGNWASLVSTATTTGLASTSQTILVESGSAKSLKYRFYVSTWTAGSWTVSIADVDDMVEQRTNRKGIVVWQLNDESLTRSGNQSITGTLGVTGATTLGGAVTQSTTTFTGAFVPYPRTLAQINALTSGTTGQIVLCSNCTRSTICTSSGTVNPGSWVISVATGTFTGSTFSGFQHCQ